MIFHFCFFILNILGHFVTTQEDYLGKSLCAIILYYLQGGSYFPLLTHS